MTDRRISELPSTDAQTLTDSDVFPVVDVSTNTTKNVTLGELGEVTSDKSFVELKVRAFPNRDAFNTWKSGVTPESGWVVYITGLGFYEYSLGANPGDPDFENWRSGRVAWNPVIPDPDAVSSAQFRFDFLTAFRRIYLQDEQDQVLATNSSVSSAISSAMSGYEVVSEEKASFTPTFKFANPGSPTPATWAYTHQYGWYNRVGSQVTWWAYLEGNLTKNSVATTEQLGIDLSGIPYTPQNEGHFGVSSFRSGAFDLVTIGGFQANEMFPLHTIGSSDVYLWVNYPQYNTAKVTAAQLNTTQGPFQLRVKGEFLI